MKKKIKIGERYEVGERCPIESGNIIEITDVHDIGITDCVSYKVIKGKCLDGSSESQFYLNSEFARYLTKIKDKNETIVIYRKGREVIALDKRTGKKGIARCNPADEFDFEAGAKLAFERLFAEQKKQTYKVGDRVRIKSWGQMVKERGVPTSINAISFQPCPFVVSMKKYCGQILTISGIFEGFAKMEESDDWNFNLDSIECKVKDEEPTYYSGKIIFTKGDNVFETGHIYEIKDGIIKTQNNSEYPLLSEPFKNLDDVKDYFTGNKNGRKRRSGWSYKTLKFIEVQDD